MTDMIIHTLACVKYKKVHRQRGTGKCRSVFLFRRAKTVRMTNVTPISINDVNHSLIGCKPTFDMNVTFNYDNCTQAEDRLKRSVRIPLVLHSYQEELISGVISARKSMAGFTGVEDDAHTLDIAPMHDTPVSDFFKSWASCISGMRYEKVVEPDTSYGSFLVIGAFDIKLLKNPVINPTQD